MTDTKQIRKDMKSELGFNARQVSVKYESCTLSGKLTFTVRDTELTYDDVEKVREFAGRYSKIDRCEMTHEILSGGNTFVDVYMTEEVKLAMTADIRPKIAAALREKEVESTGTKIEGLDDCVMWREDERTASVSVTDSIGFGRQCYITESNFDSAVLSMALSVLEQRADVAKKKKREAEYAEKHAAEVEKHMPLEENVIDFVSPEEDLETTLRNRIAIDAANGAEPQVISDLADKLRILLETKASVEVARQEAEKAQEKLKSIQDELRQFENESHSETS